VVNNNNNNNNIIIIIIIIIILFNDAVKVSYYRRSIDFKNRQ